MATSRLDNISNRIRTNLFHPKGIDKKENQNKLINYATSLGCTARDAGYNANSTLVEILQLSM